MSRHWSLRQLFSKAWQGSPNVGAAEEGASFSKRIHSGDFDIDLVTRTVTLCGQELALTSEEFDVLLFLASHPQHLVTPHTVLATTASANHLRQTEFLKALMGLRKKLESAGHGADYLRTEPWILYRFCPTSSSAA